MYVYKRWGIDSVRWGRSNGMVEAVIVLNKETIGEGGEHWSGFDRRAFYTKVDGQWRQREMIRGDLL